MVCRSKGPWDRGCTLLWKAAIHLFRPPCRHPHQEGLPRGLHMLVEADHHQHSSGAERWRKACVDEGCSRDAVEGDMTGHRQGLFGRPHRYPPVFLLAHEIRTVIKTETGMHLP